MILVVCPTRDRVQQAIRLAENVLETSTAARIAFYVDDDQITLYDPLFKMASDRIIVDYGVRCGPGPAANRLVGDHRGYQVYGFMCDDMIFATPGWDQNALAVMLRFSNDIGCISPTHTMGAHVDVPFVTRGWVEILGWFCYPNAYHYVWPTVMAVLAEAAGCIAHLSAEEFLIEHRQESDRTEGMEKDALGFYRFMLYEFYGLADKLRLAQGKEGKLIA